MVEGTARFSAFYHEDGAARYQSQAGVGGQSAGGLMLYNWAVENPKRVTCIVGINPVLDNRSYPGGKTRGDLWGTATRSCGWHR